MAVSSQHIFVIHFGLEGNCRLMPRADFNEIVSQCQPGPNPDRAKVKRLRSFPLPARFTTPGSVESPRTINILAAIVMSDSVVIVSDFCRITRLHVISSARVFGEQDLEVNCEVRPQGHL
jgi:hypothetical protein